MARLFSDFKRAPHLGSSVGRVLLWAALISSLVTVGTWASVWYYVSTANSKLEPVKELRPSLLSSTNKTLTLSINGQKVQVKPAVMAKWLELYRRAYTGKEDLRVSDRLSDYLLTLKIQTGTPAKDVRFVVANGEVEIVAPSRPGKELDVQASDDLVRQSLLAGVSEVSLPIVPVQPSITEKTIADLKITDKLGGGESNFFGSSASRIQNISVSSALYNGLLIPAGGIFSFNEILGEVDAEHGYAPEKVINDQKIQYEYGGGICQVSTTMFRAAITAGLPIVERKPHAFPVQYYNPQGFDATIYPGSTDLRFKNDTPSYILVQTRISGKTLYFDFYGTSDGRNVTIDGPHQYDIQEDGAMKAHFVRTINFANGASKSQTFYSNYKSPSLYPTEPNPYL